MLKRHFCTETCMKFVAISRQELINFLLSVIETEGVSPSPIFRSMLTVGLTPLLSQDEIDSWSEQARLMQPRTDMGPIQDNDSQSCSAMNGMLGSFLFLEERLYLEDDEYLRSRLSSYSYYSFLGEASVYFISPKGLFTISSVVFGFSLSLLTKAKVGFFGL